MEELKKKKCKICCPRCGQRLFRGTKFDIEIDCPSCGAKVAVENEDYSIRIILEFQVPEE